MVICPTSPVFFRSVSGQLSEHVIEGLQTGEAQFGSNITRERSFSIYTLLGCFYQPDTDMLL